MQFQKIYILVPGTHNFIDVSIFFAKKSAVFGKNNIPLLKAIE